MRTFRGISRRWLSQGAGWTFGVLEVPSPWGLYQLAGIALKRSKTAAVCTRAVFPAGSCPRLGRGAILARFGLEPSGLAQWTAKAASKRSEQLEDEAQWE